MVFWLWLGLFLLAVPPFAFGLVIASLYIYVRLKYSRNLLCMLNVRDRTTEPNLSKRKFRRDHWSPFRRMCEIHAKPGEDVRLETDSPNSRLLIIVVGVFVALVCIAKCIS